MLVLALLFETTLPRAFALFLVALVHRVTCQRRVALLCTVCLLVLIVFLAFRVYFTLGQLIFASGSDARWEKT